LLGLEHPVVKGWLGRYAALSPKERAIVGCVDGNGIDFGLLTIWQVVVHGKGGQVQRRVISLGMNETGERSARLERATLDTLRAVPGGTASRIGHTRIASLLNVEAAAMLHRDLNHTGLLSEGASYSANLLACVEVA
jgi:hypothetical protein